MTRVSRFTGDAEPYRTGADPYADYRRAEPADFERLTDLADRRLGGAVVAASDEFFAERENLLRHGPAVFDPARFGPKGKVMDGWETRRRRGTGPDQPHPAADDHDWALVRLGAPGVVRGVVVDTAHFRGNYPHQVSVEATTAPLTAAPADLLGEDGAGPEWTELVPRTAVGGHAANAFAVDVERRFTHLRLRQFPDGGIARLRVYGEVVPDPGWLAELGTFDLVAAEHGGVVEDASDRFYSPPANTILPGPARDMDECWETRRRRDGGHDWVRYRLAGQGLVRAAEVDTTCLKGNAAGWVQLHGQDALDGTGEWFPITPRVPLQPDAPHRFLVGTPPTTHVRMDVFPDGGIARLRLYGALTVTGAKHVIDRAERLS